MLSVYGPGFEMDTLSPQGVDGASVGGDVWLQSLPHSFRACRRPPGAHESKQVKPPISLHVASALYHGIAGKAGLLLRDCVVRIVWKHLQPRSEAASCSKNIEDNLPWVP